MKKQRAGQWIVLFRGPTVGPEGPLVTAMTDEDGYITTFETAQGARRSLTGRSVAPFACWLFDMMTGNSVDP